MARGSHLTAVLKANDVPVISEAPELAQKGFVTGASGRNWNCYGGHATLLDALPAWQKNLQPPPDQRRLADCGVPRMRRCRS
ncbi:MAG: hypothetical protein OEL53_17735 [Rhodospirillales bacterium]|nr:hypothetical protein [Rhodospirillales bacterium]